MGENYLLTGCPLMGDPLNVPAGLGLDRGIVPLRYDVWSSANTLPTCALCHGISRPDLRPRPSSTMAPTPLGNVIPGRLLRPLFVGSSPLSLTYNSVRLRRRLRSRLDGPSNATRYTRKEGAGLDVSVNK